MNLSGPAPDEESRVPGPLQALPACSRTAGVQDLLIRGLHRLGQGLLGVAAGTTLLLSPPALADQLLTFPVSPKPEVFNVQVIRLCAPGATLRLGSCTFARVSQ